MLVKVFNSLDSYDSFEVNSTNIKEILNHIKFLKNKEYTDNIIENNYKYILIDSNNLLEPLPLMPEVLLIDINEYDTLIILKDIEGEAVGAAVVAYLGVEAAAGAVVAGALAFVIDIAVAVAVSYAINTVMSLLSPTPEFSSDPSQTQASAQNKQSNLFNGAPIIREQGGSVPLILGNPFHGGILISSSISTMDM